MKILSLTKKQNIFVKMKMSKLHLTTIQPSSKDFNGLKKKTVVNAKKAFSYSCLLCNPWVSASWQFCLVMSVRFIVGPLPASDTDQDPLPQKIQKRGTMVVYSILPPPQISKLAHFFWISTLNDSAPPSLVTKLERGRQLQS